MSHFFEFWLLVGALCVSVTLNLLWLILRLVNWAKAVTNPVPVEHPTAEPVRAVDDIDGGYLIIPPSPPDVESQASTPPPPLPERPRYLPMNGCNNRLDLDG